MIRFTLKVLLQYFAVNIAFHFFNVATQFTFDRFAFYVPLLSIGVVAAWNLRHKLRSLSSRITITPMGKAKKAIVAEIVQSIIESGNFSELEASISQTQQWSKLKPSARKRLLIKGWENAVNKCLEDNLLSEEEETRLVAFCQHFALTQQDLDKNGAMSRTAKSAVLRKVVSGTVPEMPIEGGVAVNLQKGERIVWAFPKVEYLQDKKKRQYRGGSQGIGVRVTKGVYYRVGSFKGESISVTERILVDTGMLYVTDKNIYFAGPQKSARIPYKKVVSFLPFSNGFGLLRENISAMPEIFITKDGWFSFNLVTNLAQQAD